MQNPSVLAAATGLPKDTRRSFLRQLTTLPLIGGGITLIGAPTAVAEPASEELLNTYSTWLFYERRMVAIELARGDRAMAEEYEHYVMCNAGSRYFFGDEERFRNAAPSGRAALVLSAVGCD